MPQHISLLGAQL